MTGVRWIAAIGVALISVAALFLLVAQWVPEPLEAGAPIETSVEIVRLGEACAEAERLMDEMSNYAAANRQCTTRDDCVRVMHPIGCSTVVSEGAVAGFVKMRARHDALRAAETLECELRRARCRPIFPTVCENGQCSIWKPVINPTDPY